MRAFPCAASTACPARAYLDRVRGMDVLGFGPGACPRLDGMEWHNTPDVAACVATGGDFERIACEARQVAAG